jgi:hypothetical protein
MNFEPDDARAAGSSNGGRRNRMADFSIVDVPTFLNLRVTSCDERGQQVPDDEHGAETQYVLAEFLHRKGLLVAGIDVSRRSDLTIKFSELTEEGKAFVKAAMTPWMKSVDRAGPAKPVDDAGLERRWRKFIAAK